MAEYISREAAIEAAKKSHLYFDIKPIINSIPTADARPVVRGEWIKYAPDNSDMMTCSECEKYWILDGDQYDFHFCPNCGADMREES